ADGVPRRLELCAPSGGLQDAQLHLKLRRVPPEGLEGLLDALLVVAAAGHGRQLLDARERRQRRLLSSFACHQLGKYGDCIGGRGLTPLSFSASSAHPTSGSCSGGKGDGPPVSGSDPLETFGNGMISRIFGSPASSATKRSIPIAKPPCGGAPIASASSR